MSDLYSVYFQSSPDFGSITEREVHLVPISEAIRWYRHHTTNVAARMGMTVRVFVTDSGDNIVMDWRDGSIVFPKQEQTS